MRDLACVDSASQEQLRTFVIRHLSFRFAVFVRFPQSGDVNLRLLAINCWRKFAFGPPTILNILESLPHMSDERIEKIKLAVDAAGHIPADQKAVLSEALSKLKPALAQISQTNQEDAESIACLVEASAHEATRQKKRPEHLKRLSHELRQLVESSEASHPKLVAVVNEFATVLASMGI
jgi:hypothetical protein